MAQNDEDGFLTLAEFVRSTTETGYPARVVLQSTCACRHTVFRLDADEDEGCAQRTCQACGRVAFIGDSDEYWADAEPVTVICACGAEGLELAVGFSFHADDEVRWITIGARCVSCGELSVPVNWKVDYSPTDHLFERT